MLFDPFEEQLDHPPCFVQLGNGHRRQREVVCQEHEERTWVFRVAKLDPAQWLWIRLGRIEGCEDHGLIADQASASVDRARVSTLELEIVFGSGDKERLAGVDFEEPLEIEIAAVHEIVCAGHGNEIIEDVDIVHFPVGNHNELGDAASQIQQGVHLDCALVSSKACPRKHRKTQVDSRRVQGVNRGIQVDGKILVRIEPAGFDDQMLSELRVDAPVALLVGVGKVVARNCAADAHVIKFRSHGPKACFDVAQALPVGQLCERHDTEVGRTLELLDLVVAAVSSHALIEMVPGKVLHELREYRRTCVHRGLPPVLEGRILQEDSSRQQPLCVLNAS